MDPPVPAGQVEDLADVGFERAAADDGAHRGILSDAKRAPEDRCGRSAARCRRRALVVTLRRAGDEPEIESRSAISVPRRTIGHRRWTEISWSRPEVGTRILAT